MSKKGLMELVSTGVALFSTVMGYFDSIGAVTYDKSVSVPVTLIAWAVVVSIRRRASFLTTQSRNSPWEGCGVRATRHQ